VCCEGYPLPVIIAGTSASGIHKERGEASQARYRWQIVLLVLFAGASIEQ